MAEESESHFSGYERAPRTDDELSMLRWNEEHFGEIASEAAEVPKHGRR